MDLSIKINMKPEIFNGQKHYFWIIINNDTPVQSNSGCGWSTSIDDAFKDAYNYYKQIIKQRG